MFFLWMNTNKPVGSHGKMGTRLSEINVADKRPAHVSHTAENINQSEAESRYGLFTLALTGADKFTVPTNPGQTLADKDLYFSV